MPALDLSSDELNRYKDMASSRVATNNTLRKALAQLNQALTAAQSDQTFLGTMIAADKIPAAELTAYQSQIEASVDLPSIVAAVEGVKALSGNPPTLLGMTLCQDNGDGTFTPIV
jgi:hypothetical protein